MKPRVSPFLLSLVVLWVPAAAQTNHPWTREAFLGARARDPEVTRLVQSARTDREFSLELRNPRSEAARVALLRIAYGELGQSGRVNAAAFAASCYANALEDKSQARALLIATNDEVVGCGLRVLAGQPMDRELFERLKHVMQSDSAHLRWMVTRVLTKQGSNHSLDPFSGRADDLAHATQTTDGVSRCDLPRHEPGGPSGSHFQGRRRRWAGLRPGCRWAQGRARPSSCTGGVRKGTQPTTRRPRLWFDPCLGLTGTTAVHEYGHVTGLEHRGWPANPEYGTLENPGNPNDDKAVMYSAGSGPCNEVNRNETMYYFMYWNPAFLNE